MADEAEDIKKIPKMLEQGQDAWKAEIARRKLEMEEASP